MKQIKTLLIILLFSSCTPQNGFGKKFENTFLWFHPDNMEELMRSKSGEFETAIPYPNNADYSIAWKTTDTSYVLKVTADNADWCAFMNYGPAKYTEDVPWKRYGDTWILKSSKLLPPNEYGYYMIALTEDLTKIK